MKKTLLTAAVFFIFAAAFLLCCGVPKQKILPEPPAGNDSIARETPSRKEGASGIGGAPEQEGGDEDIEDLLRELPRAPEVRLGETYLRNKDVRWAAVYGNGEVLDALGKLGVRVATINSIAVAQTNGRDCATTISVGGRLLSAYDFKEALGLKSTMITEIKREEGGFIFTGYGEN